MSKRKCSKKQLAALARGRKKRKANLRRKRPYKRRKSTRRLKSPTKKKRKLKRRNSTGSMHLTGGSGDVNPQFISGLAQFLGQTPPYSKLVQYQTIPNPVSKLPRKGAKVTVLEVLKIYAKFQYEHPPHVAANNDFFQMISFSTKPHPDGDYYRFGQSQCLFQIESGYYIIGVAPVSYYVHDPDQPFEYDLTDSAGHGILVATDSIYVATEAFGYEFQNEMSWKIMYRFKNVSLTEYIGIVQSQS